MNRTGVFISYNRSDKEWLNEVKKSLTLLKVNFNLSVWHDSEIETGDNWAKEINQAIQQCKIAILLVSRHFLDSEFILKNEFPKILKATKDGVRIFSIIIDHCAYEMLELKEYQFLNDPRKPLMHLDPASKQLVLTKLTKEIASMLGPENTGSDYSDILNNMILLKALVKNSEKSITELQTLTSIKRKLVVDSLNTLCVQGLATKAKDDNKKKPSTLWKATVHGMEVLTKFEKSFNSM